MEVLAEAIESVYSILGEDHVEGEENMLTLHQSVKTLVSSLDSIDVPSTKDDHEAAEVVTQGIRVLAMLLFVGRDESNNLQEICTLIWKCYGKIIKKFSAFIDADSAKQFIDAISSHTKDGVTHISAVCNDSRESVDAYHKVLMFFGQRLALSLTWLPSTSIEEEMNEAFHILISVYGLNSLLLSTGRSSDVALRPTQQSLLKNIQKISGIEELFAVPIRPQSHSTLLWNFHEYSWRKFSKTSELFIEVHSGYVALFLSIMETEKLNYSKSSTSLILEMASRWMLHIISLVSSCNNGESYLLTLPICAKFISSFIHYNANDGHLLLDWLTCLSMGGSFLEVNTYASFTESFRFNDDISLISRISRQLLVSVLQDLSIQIVTPNNLSPETNDNSVRMKWQSNWTHRLLDMIIAQCEQLMILSDNVDVYCILENLAEIINHFLSSNIISCSEVIMRRISESFLLHVSTSSVSVDVMKKTMRHSPFPLSLLETIFSRWRVKALLFPLSTGQSSTKSQEAISTAVKSLVQKAVSLLQSSLTSSLCVPEKNSNISNSNPSNFVGDALSSSTPAICITILSSLVYDIVYSHQYMNDRSLEEFKNSLFSDEASLRNVSTRMLQLTRTLTAQMQLYTQHPRQLPVVAYKIRDWMRQIPLFLSLFRYHSQQSGQVNSYRLPNGVQRLIAECLTRIILCWKAIIVREQEFPSSFSVIKMQQILRETIRCTSSVLRLLATQSVASMKNELKQELSFALEEFAKAMQTSDACFLPVYCVFGSDLLSLVESTNAQETRQNNAANCWLEVYLESTAGTVWRNLLQLSVQRLQLSQHRQEAITFLCSLNDNADHNNTFSWPFILENNYPPEKDIFSVLSLCFLQNEYNVTNMQHQFFPPWPQYIQVIASRIRRIQDADSGSSFSSSAMNNVANTITTSTSISSIQTMTTVDTKENAHLEANVTGQKRALEEIDDSKSAIISVTDCVSGLVTKKLRFAIDDETEETKRVLPDNFPGDNVNKTEENNTNDSEPPDEGGMNLQQHLANGIENEYNVHVVTAPTMDEDTFYSLSTSENSNEQENANQQQEDSETNQSNWSQETADNNIGSYIAESETHLQTAELEKEEVDPVPGHTQPAQTEEAYFGWTDYGDEES